MALTEKITPYEFLVRWDDAGNLQGAHVTQRIAYVDDTTGVEAFSKFGAPQSVMLTDAALLGTISGQINAAVLADNTTKNAQVTAAQAAQATAEAALAQAQSLLDAANVRIAELTQP